MTARGRAVTVEAASVERGGANDLTRTLARASAVHPWRTLALSGASVVAAVAIIASFLLSALTTEGEMTNDRESYRGYDLIQEHFPFDPAEIVNEVVIVRSTSVTVDDPAFEEHVGRLAGDLQGTATSRSRGPSTRRATARSSRPTGTPRS